LAVVRVALVLAVTASISCRRARTPAGGSAPGGDARRAWVLGIGNGLDDDIRAMALMPDGGLVVVGDLPGTAKIGDRWIGAPGGTARRVERLSGDGFYLARLDAAGNPRWMRRVETDSSERTVALATTRDGAIWLFARATPATVESAGHAMLAAPGGQTTAWGARWSAAGDVEVIESLEALPKPNPPSVMDVVAADDGGALVVAGAPALVLSSASPRPDLFAKRTEGNTDKLRLHLLRYDAGGKLLWARAIKSDQYLEDARAVILADGRIVVIGKGSGTLTAEPKSTVALGKACLFRVDLDASGGVTAMRALSDPVGTRYTIAGRAVRRLDVVDGDLLIQFEYETKTALLGAAGPVRLAGERETVAFARIAPDGGVRWARNAARDESWLVPLGRELLAAGVVATGPDNNDIALSRLDGNGARLDSTRIGGLGDDAPRGMAVNAAGGLFMAGVFRRRLLIEEASPERPLDAAGDHDAFVAWFPPGRLPRASGELQRRAVAAKALRAEATSAYRAKKYAAGCAGFAKAAGLAPDDPDLRSDWALCLQKSGDRTRAIEENLTAIRLSVMHRSDTEFDYEGDRVRARSYFNLRSLKFDFLPRDEAKAPDHLLRVPGCSAALEQTVWDDVAGGSGGETTNTYRRISIPGGPVPPERYHHEESTDVVAVANMGKVRATPSSSPLRAFGNAADISLGSRFESNGRCYTYDENGDCADEPEADPGSDSTDSDCDVFLADACVGLVVSICEDENHPKRAYFQEARLAPADAWSPAAAAQP
jgi:hypothetical protein